MTEYQNKVTNPAAPWSFIADTEENILHDLERYKMCIRDSFKSARVSILLPI